MAGINFMNNQVKPISLGNTAFNTQSSGRATNVANQRINSNVLKAGNIGRQQAQLATKGIQNKAQQQSQDRDRMVQERQEDMQTAMGYAKEDMEDHRARLVQEIRSAQEQLGQQKRDDELAMREYTRDFGSQKGSEAFSQGIQGLGGMASSVISQIPGKGIGRDGLSSIMGDKLNPLNGPQFGDSLGTPLSKFAFGGDTPSQLNALKMSNQFAMGNTVQNAINTANPHANISTGFGNNFNDINIQGLFDDVFGGEF